MNHRVLFRVLVPLVLLSTLLLLASQTLGRKGSVFDQFDLLVDVRHEIVSDYVESPDQQKMTEAAVRAMVGTLDDPYTVFLSPEELEPFDKQISGTFSGIGAEVDVDETGHLRITTPLDDSPAWKAGVMAGDTVLEIDGAPLLDTFAKLDGREAKLQAAIKRLQGPEGTKVTIKVRHDHGEEQVIPITRAQINVQTVKGVRRGADHKWDYMLDPVNKIGYVRISQFTAKAIDDTKAALEQLKERNARGVILDLRFNPGGLLEAAVQISDMFLDSGKRIVSVKGRTVPERVTVADGKAILPSIPMVVLANEASASASEIVTGALADNQRAKFVGTRTFGKGSVQQVKMLEAGEGAIKITNAYYYLPNGRNIHKRKDKDVWGVDPDDGFWVPMTADQMRDMIKIRHDSDVLTTKEDGGAGKALTPEGIEKDLADPQLAAGLRAVQGKLNAGDWPKVGKSGAEQLIKEAKRVSLTRQHDLLAERLDQIDKELAKLDNPATQPATQPTTQPAK